ncbi:MAG TPA: hypothetical protein VES88_00955 [Gemmatimonadaceae bacterium]|nr:hypothetical protein [Gemmatimonadaceae bacterium]
MSETLARTEAELSTTRNSLSTANQELGQKNRILDEFSRQSVLVHSISARTRVECDRPIRLRDYSAPEIDPSNPRIGTLIKLQTNTGTVFELANVDLAVQYHETGNNRHEFAFQYQPLEPSALRVESLASLANIKFLIVNYGAVLRGLGFCGDHAVLAEFTFQVNGFDVISLTSFGGFNGGPTQYDVGFVFLDIQKRYINALAEPRQP